MEPADQFRLAKAAAPILFSTSGVSNPLGGRARDEDRSTGSKMPYEDSDDDYLANALAKNAASAAVTVGKALYPAAKQAAIDLYPAAKQAAIDLYPAVKEAVVESSKSAYSSAKDVYRSIDIPGRGSMTRPRGIEIEIAEAKVQEDRILSKHVVYTIRGRDSSGSFDSFRRYSDFGTLRSSLLARWPGLYIPAIPPKQILV